MVNAKGSKPTDSTGGPCMASLRASVSSADVAGGSVADTAPMIRRRSATREQAVVEHVDRGAVLAELVVPGDLVDGRGEFQKHGQMVRQFTGGWDDPGRPVHVENASNAIPRFRVSPAV